MSPKLKKAWNIITTVLVILVVILAVLFVGVRIFGLDVRYVESGSMEPTYHVGSLIYIKKVDPKDVKPGDPITFVLESTDKNGRQCYGTHRVVDREDAVEYIGEQEVTDVKTGKSHIEKDCYKYLQMGDAVNPKYNPDYIPDKEKFPNYQCYDSADEETREAILDDSAERHAGWVSSVNLIGKPIFTIPVLGYVAHFVQNPPGIYITIAAGALLLLLVFLPDFFGKNKGGSEKAKAADTEGEIKTETETETEKEKEAR